MAITPELDSVIKTSVDRNFEERKFVPLSFAHKALLSLACERYKRPKYREMVMAKYSPLAEWLVRPQTIEEFMKLKSDLYNLACNMAPGRSFGETGLQVDLSIYEEEWNERKNDWFKTLDWLFLLSDAFGIFPKENIEHINRTVKQGGFLGSSVWGDLEGFDEGFVLNMKREPRSLGELSTTLLYDRKKMYWVDDKWDQRIIRRVGLIIADLRVGDHAAHGKFFKRAKEALGVRGALVVIAPSKKTILETTDKKDSWDDEDRLYRLRTNRNIDFSLIVDMPSEYYQEPNKYWEQVWRAINPDFVFLGEENHPLQEVYESQARRLGGIILIDPALVTQRSGDLLKSNAPPSDAFDI